MKRSSPIEVPARPDFQHETELRAQGFGRIIGVDEAGRGPLAGPVVAGAVLFSPDCSPADWPKLNDSKQLPPATREELFVALTTQVPFGVGIVEAPEIDRINIRQASWLAMQKAVATLVEKGDQSTLMPDFVLIDGLPYGPGPWPYQALVKGDARSLSIAAASVIAKVTRDRMMIEYDREFPDYGFASHKGYGSPQHLRALAEQGPCLLHRRSYAPVRKICEMRGCN